MLSYQHAYHAGNLADIHKHQWLSRILDRLVQKDKPLSYIETHAGRGLYDLTSAESLKTSEAKTGILRSSFKDLHPAYRDVLTAVHQEHGANAYPGSPKIAQTILRPSDKIHLCELHPQEFNALADNVGNDDRVRTYNEDGLKRALKLCPPTPRRGMMMIDPSYEVKTEYSALPDFIAEIHTKWNVGVIALWYPILPSGAHQPMIAALENMNSPKTFKDEVLFDTGLSDHRLKGSGLFVINMPWMG